MIRYREQNTSQIQIGAIQSIRGAAIGCISFPILAAIQSGQSQFLLEESPSHFVIRFSFSSFCSSLLFL